MQAVTRNDTSTSIITRSISFLAVGMNFFHFAHATNRGSFRFSLGALALLCLLIAPSSAESQSLGNIEGVVKDAATRAPLNRASVTLRDATDSTAKLLGDYSDEKGAFTIVGATVGRKYRLEVKYVGYDKYVVDNVEVPEGGQSVNVGELFLQTAQSEGTQVEVTSERDPVSIRADKTVYAVENNPTYTATNVSELLGQIPSIQVDQDGKVSLRGNSNVTIMMNDRPLNMPSEQRDKFLQSLPANMVKDIEIRTNPGAQFEAKNQGGIINIVTRRTLSDLIGGNVNTGADSRKKINGGAGLYYNGKTLNASLSGGLNYGPNTGSDNSLRINYLDTNERRSVGAGASDSKSNSGYGYGQVDYHISESDVASLSFSLNNWSSEYSSTGVTTYFNNHDEIVTRFFDTVAPTGNTANSGGYNDVSFLLKHTFSEDHTLGLDVSYNSFGYSSSNIYSGTYVRADGVVDSVRSSVHNSISDQSNSTLITRLEYENPVSDELKLSFGARNERNNLDNNTSVTNRDHATGEFVADSLQTNHYLPQNTIYAFYGNVAYLPVKEISVQAGLRMELANVSAKYASGVEIISKNYANIFPSGSIAWTFTEGHSLSLTYRRSIALPSVDALNPAKKRWNDLAEYSGNPNLEPEFTQSFGLDYNTYWGMGNMVSVGPYYSTTTGSIESSQQLIDGVSYSTNQNFNSFYSLGSEASLMMRPFDWLNFRASGNVFQKVNKGSAIPGDVYSSATGYSGNLSLSVDPWVDMTFSVTSFFNRPASVGNDRQSGFTWMNVALRQRFFEKKLAISLRVNDPFNLQKWETSYTTPEFHTEQVSHWSSQSVGLNITWSFGTTPRMEQHNQEKTETKGGSTGAGGSGNQGGK